MCSDFSNLNEEDRLQNQKIIDHFVGFLFARKRDLNFSDFCELNTHVSSEMFVAVMSVLHERLPCSKFYFHQRKIFK